MTIARDLFLQGIQHVVRKHGHTVIDAATNFAAKELKQAITDWAGQPAKPSPSEPQTPPPPYRPTSVLPGPGQWPSAPKMVYVPYIPTMHMPPLSNPLRPNYQRTTEDRGRVVPQSAPAQDSTPVVFPDAILVEKKDEYGRVVVDKNGNRIVEKEIPLKTRR